MPVGKTVEEERAKYEPSLWFPFILQEFPSMKNHLPSMALDEIPVLLEEDRFIFSGNSMKISVAARDQKPLFIFPAKQSELEE